MRHSLVDLSRAGSDQSDRIRPPRANDVSPSALHALQCDVLEAVAAGHPLDRVMHLLCRRVEQLAPAVVCSVLAMDDQGHLYPLAAPSLPEDYADALAGTQVGAAIGSRGSAAVHHRCIDINADASWTLFEASPLSAGLRACWSSPIKRRDGQVIGTFAFYYRRCRPPTALERRIVEISLPLCALAIEHHRVWSRLELTNQRFDIALSNMSQGLCFFDGAQKLIVANRRYSEIYGLAPASIGPGTSLQEIVDLRIAAGSGPRMRAGAYLDWRDTVRDFDTPSDTVVELTNGRVIAIHHRPMPDFGWVATHEDVTERKRVEAQIVYMARYDALTGLPNRVLFNEKMEQALALTGRGQGCAVLCLDLDHFKAVNDTYGHSIGDALLKGVAERLAACVREVDTITRLGGDEFAVLLVGLDRPESAGELAQRIARSLSEPFELDSHSIVAGLSVGIAIAPQDGNTPDKLLKNADTALHRAKQDERGSYRFFEPEMDARLQARMALERDLRQAVRDEAFELAFQPVLNLAANAICSFEALLRWRHPTRGMISPAEFIPLAEETGLIVPIGAWVLRRACAEAKNWPSPVKVAVNLSVVQFKSRSLVETVRQALAASDLPATRLELEITESMLLKNSNDTLAMLHELRDLGASIAMDDFGTGYSSLSYLRSFPFDKIKIDQSFIRDLSKKDDSVAIIRAIVSLGRSLGMVTTAEGVETEDQLAQLRREGCTEIQGYLFSRPTSAENARRMFAAANNNLAAARAGTAAVAWSPALVSQATAPAGRRPRP
ncbi:putative bifunctional diguanylate cyclase/phosphodiesterase [Rhodopila sp.]|uniref:putative bifunctional diguanylate cyclase/phosphodiesterase n=1 Tax=Rhodopila sp. TaxID=2480087 RepID=UPI003D123E88